jgi:hypothetical protein
MSHTKTTGKDPVLVDITDCCCGRLHVMSQLAWEKYRRAVAGKPSAMPVGNGFGCWRVPRIFIACHGLVAAEIPALAERYGWAEVRP